MRNIPPQNPAIDPSVYDSQRCPDCGRIVLVALDNASKRREWGGERHVCGDLGKALHDTYPSDLGARPVDDLRKSYENRAQPEQTRTSEGTLGDNRG